jgi:UDP-2,3-diacylglucosamine pyrophosphatase LpxH
MTRERRLNKILKTAKKIPFNKNSKLVFLSDCHRGDNSISDEFAHNQNIYYHAMEYYYKEGYTYIEVGDGDELWEHKHFSDIRRAHSDIYMQLKRLYEEGRFYYLIGNHNVELKKAVNVEKKLFEFFDEYTEQQRDLFKNIETYESLLLEYEENDESIFVVHGHQGELFNDYLWRFSMFTMRYIWRYLHIIGFRNPASPAKNLHKRHKVEKKLTNWIVENQQVLIAGHTHRPKFPLPGDVPYFNDGCCVHPRNITGLEILNGEIMLIDWRIRPDEKGRLSIERNVVRGPEPLERYWESLKNGSIQK